MEPPDLLLHGLLSQKRRPDRRGDQSGLLSPTYTSTPKWEAVTALNAKMKALAPTYLALESNEVGNGNTGVDFIQAMSSRDWFIGTFTHTDDSRYFMIVNESSTAIGTASFVFDLETLEAENYNALDAEDLGGSDRTFRLYDPYGDTRLASASGSPASFSVTLDPGAGRLYRIEVDRPVR